MTKKIITSMSLLEILASALADNLLFQKETQDQYYNLVGKKQNKNKNEMQENKKEMCLNVIKPRDVNCNGKT